MKTNFLSKLFQASLVCCLAVILTGCDELLSALDNPIQTSISMATTDVKLTVGDTYQRQATTVSPATIVYTSSDATVATVDANGVVEAIAEGEATITASVAEVDYWTAASTSYKVIVSAKTPATINTAPAATASIAPNTATALVTAGVADGGTVMYKVTNVNTKPTSIDGFSATIPTAATLAAGTYYVWYYAKGDADHSDSDISATAIEVKVQSGLLTGKFTINGNATNNQVQFSQGNLQATWDGTSWTWAFATNQYDYIGNAEGNTKITNSAPFVAGYSGSSTTVDLFGWVGASSTWTGAAQYGITSSSATNATDGYGNVDTEALKSDWGTNMGTGWRTLTSAEWAYLFNTRTTTSGIRYAKATVNGKTGVILLPDDWSTSYYGLSTTADYTANDITLADWTDKLEAHGAVFLPAAGYRDVTTVNNVGTLGLYWSSSPFTTNMSKAYCAYFSSYSLNPTYSFIRYYGFSVRLVRDVE